MPKIASVGVCIPPNKLSQSSTMEFAAELFQHSFKDLPRLLKVFEHAEIENRDLVEGIEWFKENHTFEEKNNAYIKHAIHFGKQAINNCLMNRTFLKTDIPHDEIEAIFFISTTGLSTPSIEAKIMNQLPFSPHTKRIPIWGLGCAGGASGLSRAFEYCLAFPKAKVLVLAIEFCSLTFQKNDRSKSNLVGTSLFSDGVAAALVHGDEATIHRNADRKTIPRIINTQSTLMPHSEEVMGWDIKNEGLYVVFSKDIPSIITNWLKPNVEEFLIKNNVTLKDVKHFIAHPGGKKVIEAYENALGFEKQKTKISGQVLKEHGNMSSATVLYVLKEFMMLDIPEKEMGIITALGPGFSSELLLVEWGA